MNLNNEYVSIRFIELSFIFFLGVFKKYIRSILIVSVGFALIFYYYASSKPTRYLTETTFSIENATSGGFASSIFSQFGLAGGSNSGLGGDNLVWLFKSHKIIEDVFFKQTHSDSRTPSLLINYYLERNGYDIDHLKAKQIFPFTTTKSMTYSQDSLLTHIISNIVTNDLTIIKIDKKLSYVRINLISSDPTFGVEFVNLITTSASEFYIQSKLSKFKINIANIQERVDSVTTELNLAMNQLSRTQDENMFSVQSEAPMREKKIQLKVTMLSTLYSELVKNLEINKTLMTNYEPLFTIIDETKYPKPIRPRKLTLSIFGFFVGLLVTSITIFIYNLKRFLKEVGQSKK